MLLGYYDRYGYDGRRYNELIPGGIAAMTTFDGGDPLAEEAIASSGHVADFYVGYGQSGNDPLASGRVIPDEFDCLADFMGTSQDSVGNIDGSTTFWYYTSDDPLYAEDIYALGPSYYEDSGMFGLYEYVDHCGYGSGNPTNDTNFFNQYIDARQPKPGGFTFGEYQAEIDAGRPMLIHLDGHTMLGYGYDDTGGQQTVLLHDTWSPGEHTMEWGTSYGAMDHVAVTGVHLVGGDLTGDADRDEDVDISDLSALAAHWGQSGTAQWSDGDFDGDLDVDINDLSALACAWGAGTGVTTSDAWNTPSGTVPEPTLFAVLGFAMAVPAGRRRRRIA